MSQNGWTEKDEKKLHERLENDIDFHFKLNMESTKFEMKLGKNSIPIIAVIGILGMFYIGLTSPTMFEVSVAGIVALGIVGVISLVIIKKKSKKWYDEAYEIYVKEGDEELERYKKALTSLGGSAP